MIKLTNISKTFGKKIAVNNLNLHIEKGCLTMFIGPSGCGKTFKFLSTSALLELSVRSSGK